LNQTTQHVSSVNYETERKLFVEAWGDTKHGSMSSCIIMFPCAEIYNFVVGHCFGIFRQFLEVQWMNY